RKLVLGASYVAGMALVYALAGVAAGLSGVYLADALQNPWVLALFGLFFLMLAMAMFGFYSLELPHAVQNRLHLMTGNMKGGRAWVVFFMGGVSAVLVGPCIAPPLAGALLYISHAQNAPLGAMALFFMALGMGLPLVVVGLTAGTLLPRSGVWMEEVKRFFGIVLLGTGFYVVSPILPISVLMMAYALLAFLAAWLIWHATSSFRQFRYGLALLRVVAGIFLAIGLAETVGVLNGSSDIFSPLSSQRESLPHFLPANTLAALDRQLALARGRPVMLDFYADWCVSCKEMDRFVFSRPRVKQALSGLVLIRADVTVNSADTRLLMKHFGLYGPPALLFFDKQGREIHLDRVVGALSEGQFLTFLNKILPGY
ncbi:MAG: protein-disulfide reductase DsbD, partial [Pseudomonadota bacterium]|nr:protein-disulfide reductase DsbD [Pseudomonadota bacterium]